MSRLKKTLNQPSKRKLPDNTAIVAGLQEGINQDDQERAGGCENQDRQGGRQQHAIAA